MGQVFGLTGRREHIYIRLGPLLLLLLMVRFHLLRLNSGRHRQAIQLENTNFRSLPNAKIDKACAQVIQ